MYQNPCMPAVPPLYPMEPYMSMPQPMDPCMPMPPMDPCMSNPVPMYSPNGYQPMPMHPSPEGPFMCPIMNDPMLRHCMELCMRRCRKPIDMEEYPMGSYYMEAQTNAIENYFTPQFNEETVE